MDKNKAVAALRQAVADDGRAYITGQAVRQLGGMGPLLDSLGDGYIAEQKRSENGYYDAFYISRAP